MKRLKTSIKKKIYKLLLKKTGGKIIKEYFGCYFLLSPSDFVDRVIVFEKNYEKNQIKNLLHLSKKYKADVFLDIGCNFGLYSVIVAKNTEISEIHSFDPDIRNICRYHANIWLNKLSSKIESGLIKLHQCAVSEKKATLNFHPFSESSTGQSHITEETTATQVNAIPVDDLNIKGKTVLIKVDVEGHELSVLKGMKKTLQNNHVILQIEGRDDTHIALQNFLSKMPLQRQMQIAEDHIYISSTLNEYKALENH